MLLSHKKKKEIMPFVVMRMGLEIQQNQVSQTNTSIVYHLYVES